MEITNIIIPILINVFNPLNTAYIIKSIINILTTFNLNIQNNNVYSNLVLQYGLNYLISKN